MAMVNGSVPRWVADLQSPPASKSKVPGISDPPGYPSQFTGSKKQKDQKVQPRKQQSPEEMDTLKVKKAWEVALAPVKNLPMTAIMMYMSGNSLQIFSIMMVFMAFKNPLAGLTAVNQAFERFESETNKGKMLQVKLAYVAMQFVALGLAVWKVNSMGLLPTTRSDWLAWEILKLYHKHLHMLTGNETANGKLHGQSRHNREGVTTSRVNDGRLTVFQPPISYGCYVLAYPRETGAETLLAARDRGQGGTPEDERTTERMLAVKHLDLVSFDVAEPTRILRRRG
ncbi:hypothetical protein CkaCkLH20_00788 [Colletotrichum karsti]|uniref:ER membrane protein complex subunit 4 n=1 Tax=Colletotrichum karsti TaxID=1095194 RepID=A0A9P6LR17_9PEZI|nr:uncharacterized protein CkaCkLH20_00788 [Colletotrichum karsti]KAF9881642.1 hypothetical protein CkaCkLH20_00788 [Colletotrichum karsti]